MRVTTSIWGEVQQCKTLIEGAACKVSTAGHGGVVVNVRALPLLPYVLAAATQVEGDLAYYEEDNDWGALAIGSGQMRHAIESSNRYYDTHDIVRSAVGAIRRANPEFLKQHLTEFDENTVEGKLVREAIVILDADPQDFAKRKTAT